MEIVEVVFGIKKTRMVAKDWFLIYQHFVFLLAFI